jgi:hypothetical protein
MSGLTLATRSFASGVPMPNKAAPPRAAHMAAGREELRAIMKMMLARVREPLRCRVR